MFDKHLGHPFGHGASIWPGTRLQQLPYFYAMQGHHHQYFRKTLRHLMLDKHFGASIWLGIWGIHIGGNQIVRGAMFLCHTRSPLTVALEKPVLVVQENLTAFNV